MNNSNNSNILITTSDIKDDYEIIDAIFALDSCREGFFNAADPNKAFDKVKDALRKKASELGAHAVINCQFEYRVALSTVSFGSSKQVIAIFAYGTAVRLH